MLQPCLMHTALAASSQGGIPLASPSSPHLASISTLAAMRYMHQGSTAYMIMVRSSSACTASCNTTVASEPGAQVGPLPSIPDLSHLTPELRDMLLDLPQRALSCSAACRSVSLAPCKKLCSSSLAPNLALLRVPLCLRLWRTQQNHDQGPSGTPTDR